jgi:hypothetical protein
MKKPAHHPIAEVPRRQAKVEITIGIDLGDVWSTYPIRGGDFGLDGLVKNAIETLDEGGWVFERDAFEKEGLVEE